MNNIIYPYRNTEKETLHITEQDYKEEQQAIEEYAEEHRYDITFRINQVIDRINKMYSPIMTNKECGHLDIIIDELNYIKKDWRKR